MSLACNDLQLHAVTRSDFHRWGLSTDLGHAQLLFSRLVRNTQAEEKIVSWRRVFIINFIWSFLRESVCIREKGNLRSTTRRQRQRNKICIFNGEKQKLCTPFTCFFLFLYISLPFSANLRREMTISQVLQKTLTNSREFEFSFLALTLHL